MGRPSDGWLMTPSPRLGHAAHVCTSHGMLTGNGEPRIAGHWQSAALWLADDHPLPLTPSRRVRRVMSEKTKVTKMKTAIDLPVTDFNGTVGLTLNLNAALSKGAGSLIAHGVPHAMCHGRKEGLARGTEVTVAVLLSSRLREDSPSVHRRWC
jgi:hypothetical protein